jgi:hypothetical protein
MRNPQDYRQIIFGLAYKFGPSLKGLGYDVEDLIGEGYLVFMEILQEERKNGLTCEFEAALSKGLKQKLIYLTQKKSTQKRTGITQNFSDIEELIGKNPWKKIEDYISLSEEAKEVVGILWGSPKELIELLRTEKFKDALSKYLKKYCGWEINKINKFWADFG